MQQRVCEISRDVYLCALICVGVYTEECVLLRNVLVKRTDSAASKVCAGREGEAGVTRTQQRCTLCGQEDRRAQPVSIHQRRSLLSKLAPPLMYERAAG